MRRSVIVWPLLLLVTGCSIVQRVTPVTQRDPAGTEICVLAWYMAYAQMTVFREGDADRAGDLRLPRGWRPA